MKFSVANSSWAHSCGKGRFELFSAFLGRIKESRELYILETRTQFPCIFKRGACPETETGLSPKEASMKTKNFSLFALI